MQFLVGKENGNLSYLTLTKHEMGFTMWAKKMMKKFDWAA